MGTAFTVVKQIFKNSLLIREPNSLSKQNDSKTDWTLRIT